MVKQDVVHRLLLTVILSFTMILISVAQTDMIISGWVFDDNGAVPDATVRVQTTQHASKTDQAGHFVLQVPDENPVALTACAIGYYCVGPLEAHAGETDVKFQLIAHSNQDFSDYNWLSSRNAVGNAEDQGCAECHSSQGTAFPHPLLVDEWEVDAHSQTTSNERFLTMYLGIDVQGNHSPPTRYVTLKDYGKRPLPPESSQDYYGPGYKLDFPESDGNCAACHAPAAAVNSPYEIDPTQLGGVDAQGIPCDFCHKVWDVRLNPANGLPYANMPGVLSFEFRRPPEDHQFFAGPFDDVAPGEDTYSPLQTESAFCAPCHHGVFWDTVIYNSFGEWLVSPYSLPETGQSCQDCHMPPPSGRTVFALPDRGGLERNPQTLSSHKMPGTNDLELLQNTIDMNIDATREVDQITVSVSLENVGAGHHVPTDSPLRQMLLIVTAHGETGESLQLSKGDTLSDWTGDYSGQGGTYFALILEEIWTGIVPSGAYWNPTRVIADTRLPALATHESRYVFDVSDDRSVTVQVRLIFRRAFDEIMRQKGWNAPDILMEEQIIVIP